MKRWIIACILLPLFSCAPKPPARTVYFIQPKERDFSVPPSIRVHMIRTPHYIPVRDSRTSIDLINKYNLMYSIYNKRR